MGCNLDNYSRRKKIMKLCVAVYYKGINLIIIGIGGGTASGKTTIASLLKEYFKNDISIISCDNYYLSRSEISFNERKKINFDIPASIDVDKIVKDIKSLKMGKTIAQPIFSFATLLEEKEKNKTYPSPILVVEGIFVFYFEVMRELFDIKVYLDVDSDVRFARRIIRDTTRYDKSMDYVISKYLNYAKPMHNIYVEPYKRYADIIIPFYENNVKSIDILIKIIENRIM